MTRNNPGIRFNAIHLFTCAFFAATLAISADAGDLTVRVLNSSNPNTGIGGSQVCLIAGSGSRAESKTADGQGTVVFSGVPQGPAKLIATKSGFTGAEAEFNMGGANQTQQILLQQGSGGPTCQSGSVPQKGMRVSHLDVGLNRRIPGQFELRINFSIDPGDLNVSAPTHYRIGYKPDLSDASWLQFEGFFFFHLIPFPPGALTVYGTTPIYFQARVELHGGRPVDMARDTGAEIHTSPIAGRSITLAVPGKVEYKLQGEELKAMLRYAEDRGFDLNHRVVSVTQSHCPQFDFDRSHLRFSITSGGLSRQAWHKVVEVSLLELGAKKFTSGWQVKDIVVGDTTDLAADGSRTFAGARDGDGFRLTIRLSAEPRPTTTGGFPAPLVHACLDALFPLKHITLEGPRDDVVLDSSAPWKNAFPSK